MFGLSTTWPKTVFAAILESDVEVFSGIGLIRRFLVAESASPGKVSVLFMSIFFNFSLTSPSTAALLLLLLLLGVLDRILAGLFGIFRATGKLLKLVQKVGNHSRGVWESGANTCRGTFVLIILVVGKF